MSNNKLQLFVRTQTSDSDWLEVDLYQDESINYVDSIQDVKDISKIYNSFSKSFNLPASKRNNFVFGNYYNNQIRLHDARFKVQALIKIGGVDYKEGFLSLIDVKMINEDNPERYKVTFSDSTIILKDLVKDDKLGDLNFNEAGFDLQDPVKDTYVGIRRGLYRLGEPELDSNGHALYPDIIYPPIFTRGKAVPIPKTSSPGNNVQQNFDCFLGFWKDTPDGVSTQAADGNYYIDPVLYSDYKPAVKVGTLLKMINNRYGLNFNQNFMDREELDQMYMWFNAKDDSETAQTNSVTAFNGESNVTSETSTFVYRASNAPALAGDFNNLTHEAITANGAIGSVPPFVSGAYGFDTDLEDKAIYNALLAGVHKNGFERPINMSVEMVVKKVGTLADTYSTVFKTTIVNVQDSKGFGSVEENNLNTNHAFRSTVVNGASHPGRKYWLENRQPGDELFYIVTLSSDADMSGVSLYTRNIQISSKEFVGIYYAVETRGWVYHYDNIYSSQPNTVFTYTNENLAAGAPDIKIIDFLTNLFKMFNFTIYKESNDTETVVEALPEYYRNKNTIDLTPYIDLDDATISKASFFKDVKMKYDKSKDVLSKNHVELFGGIGFPDKLSKIEGDSEDVLKEGKDLDIKSTFTCMKYERLFSNWNSDSISALTPGIGFRDPNAATDFVVGHAIDSKLKKEEIKNLIFFAKKVNTQDNFRAGVAQPETIREMSGRYTIDANGNDYVEHGNTAGMVGSKFNGRRLFLANGPGPGTAWYTGVASDVPILEDSKEQYGDLWTEQWWNPSNTMASRFRRDGSYMNSDANFQSLLFSNNNLDEFEYFDINHPTSTRRPIANSAWLNGLHETYYDPYLSRLRDVDTRVYTVKADLPVNVVNQYKLSDRFVVGNREFTINKLNTNLMNGKSKIELLTIDASEITTVSITGLLDLTYVAGITGDITFNVTGVHIPSGILPRKIRVYSGDLNNNTVYEVNLTDNNYVSLGVDIYGIQSIDTTGWVLSPSASDLHNAYVVLESPDGTLSAPSNTIEFQNSSDTVDPVLSLDSYVFRRRGDLDITYTIDETCSYVEFYALGPGTANGGTLIGSVVEPTEAGTHVHFMRIGELLLNYNGGSGFDVYARAFDMTGNPSDTGVSGDFGYSKIEVVPNFVFSLGRTTENPRLSISYVPGGMATMNVYNIDTPNGAVALKLYNDDNDEIETFTLNGFPGTTTQTFFPALPIGFVEGYYVKAIDSDSSIESFPSNIAYISGYETSFVGVFNTDTATKVILPYVSGGTYSGTIDWGDGTTSVNSFANRSHTYANPGEYTVTVKGTTVGFRFGGTGNTLASTFSPENLIKLNTFGTNFKLGNTVNDWGAFEGCINLEASNSIDVLNFGETSLASLLKDCEKVTQFNLNYIDSSNLEYMTDMLCGAELYNEPLNLLDTSNVKDMSGCFKDAVSFIQHLNTWDYSSLNSTTALNNFMSGKSFDDYPYEYYDALLDKWVLDESLGGLPNTAMSGGTIHMGNIRYCFSSDSRQNIIDIKGINIIDGGAECFLITEASDYLVQENGDKIIF